MIYTNTIMQELTEDHVLKIMAGYEKEYKKNMRIPFWRFIPVLLLLRLAAFAQAPGQPSGGANTGPRSAMQIYEAGRYLEAQNRTSEAETYYNEAIRICQDEISRNVATRDTYAVITWAMRRQNKHADVLLLGEQCLRVYSDEYRVIETIGESYFYLGDYGRSLNYMQRYVNSIPQGGRASVAYFFIGEIYRFRGQFRHADIAYTTAVRLEPGLALWWYRLGSVREAVGDFSPAIEAYERAIILNPNYREANDGLARSRRQIR